MVLLGMRYAKGPDGTRGFAIGRGKAPSGVPPSAPPPRQAPRSAAPEALPAGLPPPRGAGAAKPAATTAAVFSAWAAATSSQQWTSDGETTSLGTPVSMTPPGCTPPGSHAATPSMPPGLVGSPPGLGFGLPSAATPAAGAMLPPDVTSRPSHPATASYLSLGASCGLPASGALPSSPSSSLKAMLGIGDGIGVAGAGAGGIGAPRAGSRRGLGGIDLSDEGSVDDEALHELRPSATMLQAGVGAGVGAGGAVRLPGASRLAMWAGGDDDDDEAVGGAPLTPTRQPPPPLGHLSAAFGHLAPPSGVASVQPPSPSACGGLPAAFRSSPPERSSAGRLGTSAGSAPTGLLPGPLPGPLPGMLPGTLPGGTSLLGGGGSAAERDAHASRLGLYMAQRGAGAGAAQPAWSRQQQPESSPTQQQQAQQQPAQQQPQQQQQQAAPGAPHTQQVAQLQQQSQAILQQLHAQRHNLTAEQQIDFDQKLSQWHYQQRQLQVQQEIAQQQLQQHQAQAQHQLRQQQMHALQQQSAAYEVQQRQLMHGQQPMPPQQQNPLQQLQQQQQPPPQQPQQQPPQRLPGAALPLGNSYNGPPSAPPMGSLPLPGFAPQPAASRPTGESQQLIEQTNHLKSLLGL